MSGPRLTGVGRLIETDEKERAEQLRVRLWRGEMSAVYVEWGRADGRVMGTYRRTRRLLGWRASHRSARRLVPRGRVCALASRLASETGLPLGLGTFQHGQGEHAGERESGDTEAIARLVAAWAVWAFPSPR